MRNLKETKYFVDEMETQLREKPFQGSHDFCDAAFLGIT
jgi:hypothetical protein